MRRQPLRASLALALACAALAGCGSSSSTAPPPQPKLAITYESFGRSVQVRVPASLTAGVVQMQFINHANGPHSAQLIRMDPGHDALSAIRAGNAWGNNGKPLPGWIHLEGGFGTAKPGQTLAGVGKFVAGNYAVLDLESKGKPVYGTFAVKGQPGKATIKPSPATVVATDSGFTAHGLRAGSSFLFENRGKQPHAIAAAPLRPGATLADVRRYVTTHKGRSPVVDKNGTDSAVLDGGARQLTTLGGLKPGKYALISFVPDRSGGKPQALKGMIGEAVVR